MVYTRKPICWVLNSEYLGDYEHAISDWDINRLITYLNVKNQYALTYRAEACMRNLESISTLKRFNPIKSFIESSPWDGTPRLDNWLTRYLGCVATTFTQLIAPKVIMGLIARTYNKGCKFDYMLVLEGRQGDRKSSFLEALGSPWYYGGGYMNLGKEGTPLQLKDFWLIEMSELDSMGKMDIRRFKSYLSQTEEKVRAPYGRKFMMYKRNYVFIGTTNETAYLHDDSGNRRFWPVEVGNIDIDLLKKERQQLFAEALVRYRQNERLYLTSEEEHIADAVRVNRFDFDEWTIRIQKWLLANKINIVTGVQIWEDCLFRELSTYTRKHQYRIGSLLRAIGFIRRSKREDDGTVTTAFYKQGTR